MWASGKSGLEPGSLEADPQEDEEAWEYVLPELSRRWGLFSQIREGTGFQSHRACASSGRIQNLAQGKRLHVVHTQACHPGPVIRTIGALAIMGTSLSPDL